MKSGSTKVLLKFKVFAVATALLILLGGPGVYAGDWEASVGVNDDTLCRLCPDFSLVHREKDIETGILVNPNEVIIPLGYHPPHWGTGAVLSLDFRHGWDLYVYVSGRLDWVIKEGPSLSTTLKFELGAKGGIGGTYHKQPPPLLYYAPHWLVGLRQDLGRAAIEVDFAGYDRFRSDQLLGPLIHGLMRFRVGPRVDIGAFCSLVFANGLNELAYFRARRGGVLCVIKDF